MKRLISSVLAMVMAFSLCVPAIAADKTASDEVRAVQDAYGLSAKAVDFLVAHNVDLSALETAPASYSNDPSVPLSMDSEIQSLILETEAYDFTDEQIQQYVDGLAYSDPVVVPKDGSAPYASSIPPYSDYPSDGPGYEVCSKVGYCTATAFVTLPSAYNVMRGTEGTSNGYMFYTVASGTWAIDVGLAYNHGYYDGNGWRGGYTPQGGTTVCGSVIPELKAGSKVYFHANIETSGYLRFRILDGNDFSKTYYDISYYVGSNGIYPTNGIFNRQITMTSNFGDYTNGSYMKNARFYDAYLYTASGSYSKTGAANVQSTRCGLLRFGTKQLATLNSYTPWYEENVSIVFS